MQESQVVRYMQAEPEITLAPHAQALYTALNRRIGAAETLDAVMHLLFEETRRAAAWDRLGLAFIEEDGSRATSAWCEALYAPLHLQSGYSEGIANSSLQRILSRGDSRIIDDMEAYAKAHPQSKSTRLLLAEGVRSNLTTPLYVDARPIGFFFRSSRRPRAFGEEDVALSALIVERLAQVVDKAWRIEQLRRTNQAYVEMLGFITHELKSPLASMISSTQLLTEGYLGELSDRQNDRLRRIQRQGEHLMGLVRDYLELARLEDRSLTGEMLTHQLHDDLITPALDIVRDQLDANDMQLSQELPPAPARVHGCADQLRLVLVNLLNNAAKYGNPGGRIRLSAELNDDAFTCTVWNEGPGFSAEEQHRLFRKFSRLQAPELRRRAGTGLGLYICWRIVTNHSGTITADSHPGKYAAFTIRLPQPIPTQ